MINLLKRYERKQGQEEKEEIMSMASHNLARSHIMDLCDASKLSDTKSMNFLLMCGEEVNKKKTIYGIFPLLEASKAFADKTGTLEPVNMLLKSGANINEQDTNGWTVLHHASAMGNRTIVEKLVKEREKNKLNINIFTNKRYHALHLAAMRNHSEIIEVLLTGEAKVDVRDWDERTPLHHAAKKGAVQALNTLLEHKASLNAIDIRKMNALHFAASGSNSFFIQIIQPASKSFLTQILIKMNSGMHEIRKGNFQKIFVLTPNFFGIFLLLVGKVILIPFAN